jgi:hypothetical protein
MKQFVWAIPVLPARLDQVALEVNELTNRMVDLPRGIVPPSAQVVTVGVDLEKYLLHWIAVAWSPRAVCWASACPPGGVHMQMLLLTDAVTG